MGLVSGWTMEPPPTEEATEAGGMLLLTPPEEVTTLPACRAGGPVGVTAGPPAPVPAPAPAPLEVGEPGYTLSRYFRLSFR